VFSCLVPDVCFYLGICHFVLDGRSAPHGKRACERHCNGTPATLTGGGMFLKH